MQAANRTTIFEYMERFDFYERAKHAYAIVATSETSLFANIILKKAPFAYKRWQSPPNAGFFLFCVGLAGRP